MREHLDAMVQRAIKSQLAEWQELKGKPGAHKSRQKLISHVRRLIKARRKSQR